MAAAGVGGPGVQRAFAARMLAGDPAGDPVYFVDDHFVAYAGARPVGKGWNTKRRHAGPGREDTLLVDARGRAVVFGSGEPTGLSTSLPGVLAQLRSGDRPAAPVLLGFDRGGAYPVTFTACRDAGADWVTRRAPLVETASEPSRSWTVRDGKRVTVVLADETVQLKGYGQARHSPCSSTTSRCCRSSPASPARPARTCCAEAWLAHSRRDRRVRRGRSAEAPRDQQARLAGLERDPRVRKHNGALASRKTAPDIVSSLEFR